MLPNFDFENLHKELVVAGIDEAGRGPLCGPVVASCVILSREKYPDGLNDSKQLSEKRRETIFAQCLDLESEGALKFGVGIISPQIIDEINIRNATKVAMKAAYEDLCKKYNVIPGLVLVDGNFIPEINTKAEYIIKGDEKCLSISAASIIAKVTRDAIMYDLAKQFPEYDWHKNKGYGTKKHIEKIKELGMTIHHRRSFLKGILASDLFDI
jgi:ribonuclease HII